MGHPNALSEAAAKSLVDAYIKNDLRYRDGSDTVGLMNKKPKDLLVDFVLSLTDELHGNCPICNDAWEDDDESL